MPIDLPTEQLAMVRQILADHVPEYITWAFGSRVTGTAKVHSDLDLVILTDQPLTALRAAKLVDSFSESDLPIKVDVVDWASIEQSFQQIIQDHHEIVRDNAA